MRAGRSNPSCHILFSFSAFRLLFSLGENMFTRTSSLRWALLAGASLACLSPAFAQEESDDGAQEELRQQTIQVRGQFIPDEKRSTSEVSSLLDAGDFDRSTFS